MATGMPKKSWGARGEGRQEEKRAGRLRNGQRIIFRYLPALEFFERPPPTSYQ